jgi:membrane-associated protease RseP (regulator of RpoE activity)
MNTTAFTITAPALFAALLIPASLHAIEAPEDNAPPPAQAAKPDAKPAAFLGIMTERVPQAVREHLDLGDQQGVIISSVIPDGPAAKAGLVPNEIITAIGDKKVIAPEEVSAIIADQKPGDEILISTIRKGKATEHKITLGERPAHLPIARPMALDHLPALENMPKELADRIRRMVEENAQGFEMQFFPFAEPMPAPEIEGAVEEMRKKMGNAIQGGMKFELGLDGNGFNAHRQTTFRMMDNEGSIELKSQDDAKEVTVRDNENNIIWNGPWDTDQDKAAAPDDIRLRIERLNIDDKVPGLRLNLRQR